MRSTGAAPARPRLREEQRSLTRQRIASAARSCFYAGGVTDTSMEQIARAAGIGRATLYLHFASKDAILLDLLSANLRGVRAIFAELGEPDAARPEAVRDWLRRYVATMQGHRAAMRLFHVGLANDPEARELVDDHRDRVVAMIARRLPDLAADPPQRARALLVLARIDHIASAAAEEQPRFDIAAGVEIVAIELAALLSDPGRDDAT